MTVKSKSYYFDKNEFEECRELRATHYFTSDGTGTNNGLPTLYRFTPDGELQNYSHHQHEWHESGMKESTQKNLLVIPYPECKNEGFIPADSDIKTVMAQMINGKKYYNEDGSVVYEFDPNTAVNYPFVSHENAEGPMIHHFPIYNFDVENWYKKGYTFEVKNFDMDPRDYIIDEFEKAIGRETTPNEKLLETIANDDIPLSQLVDMSRVILKAYCLNKLKQY